MWTLQSRLPFVATLITFVCVVIMFALGIWQLQRAEEKTLRLIAIEHAAKTDEVDLQQVLRGNINEMQDMPINLNGVAESAQYFLLDNKIHEGRVGYQVLVPIQTKSGTVMANFGWVAATSSRKILPSIQINAEQKLYAGVISIPVNNAMVTETAIVDGNWPKVLQQTDLSVIEQHYSQALLPFVVLLNPHEGTPFVRSWQPVVMAPEKHLAYAVQWFLLGLAAIAIFIIAHRNKRNKNKLKRNKI